MGRHAWSRRELLALGAAVGAAVVLGFAMSIFIRSAGFGYDYAAYDAAARRIASGAPLYIADTAARYAAGLYEGLYLYPPPLAIALTPLTILAVEPATIAWMVGRAVVLALACSVIPVAGWIRAATFAVACITFPVLFDLNIGNISLVILALTIVAWRWMDRPAAAIAHALLIAVRFPFGIFLLEWLVQRRWRAMVMTIVAGLVVIAITLPIVGFTTYMDYVTILRGLPDISTGPHNLSFKTFALGIGGPPLLAEVANLVGYALGLAAVVFAAARRDRDTAFVVTVVATMMVAPFIHPHYLVLLIVPAAWLAARGRAWALALPLLGWLPDLVLPLVAPVTVALVLWTPAPAAEAGPARLDADPMSATT